MTDPEDNDDELLIEMVASAHRFRAARGLPYLPAFHDLDEDGRERAHDLAVALRPLEAAMHEQGYSSTVRAVMARLER